VRKRSDLASHVHGAIFLAVAGAVWCGSAIPASAQDVGLGRDAWLHVANCSECHGWMGDGAQEDPRAPRGANLRETKLNAEQIAEVILCGRPGTPMPAFDQRAYTDARCYGMAAGQLGNAEPTISQIPLTKRHAQALAAFILAEFTGKGAPTLETCTALLGAAAARCGEFRRTP